MRDALIAHSRGECDTPMPMHLDIARNGRGPHEVQLSARRPLLRAEDRRHLPGQYRDRGLSTSNGMMLLSSAETGEPVAFLADAGI